MKDTKSQEIKVGIITIAGILLLVLGITFGKSLDLSTSANIIKFVFPTSGGLQKGEPIVVNGVSRGRVLSVINQNGAVLVEGSLDNINDIMADASARITILEITGGKKIEIAPGKSEQPFDLNDYVPGSTPPDIAGLVAVVGELSTDGAAIIKRLDTISLHINNILSDDKFIGNIKNTVENASAITDDLKYFADNNLGKLSSSIDDLSKLSKSLNEALLGDTTNIRTIIKDIDVVLQNTKALTSDANSTLKKADNLIENLNKLSDEVRNGDGLVSKIIYDEKFAGSLDSTITQLQHLVNMIKMHGVNVNVRLGTRP